MIISLVPTSAGAANVGDVIGTVTPTDIIATINGYQIESYNVFGNMYIAVDDLKYYGFDVYYDNPTRTLSFTRNSVTKIDPQNTNPDFWAINTAKPLTNIIYSDIITYANGYYAPSCCINGKIVINFNELARFGTVAYNDTMREISLKLEGVNYNELADLAQSIQIKNASDPNWKCIARAKGSVLILQYVYRSYLSAETVEYYKWNLLSQCENASESGLTTYASKGWPVTSVYVEMLNNDGTYIASHQAYINK